MSHIEKCFLRIWAYIYAIQAVHGVSYGIALDKDKKKNNNSVGNQSITALKRYLENC